MEDSLRISQMIVSCVVRLNQRYGVDYTAKVLTATSEPRINSLGHDKLSTHGLLSEYPIAAVKSWMDQIIAQGYLARTTEQYSTVTVTASGKRLLKGDASVRLSRPVESTVSKRTKPNDSWEGIDRGVFEMLRNLRSRLSTERKVPAFVIFGDTTLREIARVRPSTLQAFSQLPGVGERKLLDLGQAFIDATVEYCKSQKIPTDVNAVSVRNQGAQPVTTTASGSKQANLTPSSIATFAFWKSGMSIEAVCEKTSRARSTVCGYLGDYIQTHRITDPSPWVSASEIAEVESAIAATRITDRLRPLFDYTEGKISFDSIRFVLGCYNNRMREQDAGEGNLATANDQGSST
jgi:ATP-dependent DNA helicase RecQ